MAYWKRTIRKINGHRRVVKVHSGTRGTGRVRVIGRRNSTDANKRRGSVRKKKYYNTTDNSNRRSGRR
jgi:hypothetical protein